MRLWGIHEEREREREMWAALAERAVPQATCHRRLQRAECIRVLIPSLSVHTVTHDLNSVPVSRRAQEFATVSPAGRYFLCSPIVVPWASFLLQTNTFRLLIITDQGHIYYKRHGNSKDLCSIEANQNVPQRVAGNDDILSPELTYLE
ncbi:hypothetical protein MPTK1_8g17080 [Marchantia polymorpha subsp. ruderalis]|uniref:Uncharacterized protein n=1 Tax=Marchantia polymorpha TaxID=3197 RepID=A0A2R6X863_MARPO|nr:hypothetical protein MARPO_0030s0041 [Marchantia polymorpha]BBN20179.1 hypothetical protein Mp_8g17080 [Marchantia polymorpha subsp. ruderalis]|eukprot:PTQ42295.1 hypothetical protein MARPO_0030s0041 [Marchantia polymorpha]